MLENRDNFQAGITKARINYLAIVYYVFAFNIILLT